MMKNASVFNTITISLLFFVLITTPFHLSAQDQDDMTEAYERAESMLSWNLNGKILKESVNPNQINENHFWYQLNTAQGTEYFLVDVLNRTKGHAFDHRLLADSVSEVLEIDTEPFSLNLRNLSFSSDLSEIIFERNGQILTCDIDDYSCEITGEPKKYIPSSVTSPDGNLAAFTRDYDLWVADLETGEETQLTFDGVEYHSYATDNHGWRRSDRPILKWSPDSKKIATFRLDERDVGKMTLWSTEVGRPEADIWPYALPGDSIVPMLERVVIDVNEQETVFLDVEPDHQRTSNCCGLIRNGDWADIEWSDDSEKLAFVSTSRDYKDVTLRMADPESGEVQDIYHEHDEIFFESNITSRGLPNWRVLHDSSEFIWFTRKDNWGHLYLHDLETGEEKNRITSGDWNVVDIYHIDKEERTIYFTAVGDAYPGDESIDPYFEHLYKINFDGSGFELLSPEIANHSIYLSDDATWFVSNFSTFENAPVSVLRDSDGNLLMELEEADISELLDTGWQHPKPFSVKARDGETDIYGIMILPSDFDETKSYPIVNSIYPGPQSGSIGSRSFSASQRGQAHALAELGFVVVAIDAFGSSPLRSREFHTAYYGDMIDNGLPDQITGMEQLAERYDFIDIDRAGIYGHSGGGFATSSALFQYPEFFKVGVSGAGNHDNRGYTYYWGEKYQGLLEEEGYADTYTNQAVQRHAENLQGKLLISYGTMDTNVHPSMTLLVIDALIHHNKDFDLIVMPNRGHGYANEPYNIRQTWDYFVRHLAGNIPPYEYQINR